MREFRSLQQFKIYSQVPKDQFTKTIPEAHQHYIRTELTWHADQENGDTSQSLDHTPAAIRYFSALPSSLYELAGHLPKTLGQIRPHCTPDDPAIAIALFEARQRGKPCLPSRVYPSRVLWAVGAILGGVTNDCADWFGHCQAAAI